MKKNFLAMATLACGLLTFSACSNDDDFAGNQQGVATEELCDVTVNFDFNVNAAGTTRAGRPLYSEEALQRVNNMKIYAFKEEGGAYKYVSEVEDKDGNGFGFKFTEDTGTESKKASIKDKLAKGNYKFLAVGYEEETVTTYSPLDLVAGTTTLDQLQLKLADPKRADEVFSGVSDIVTVNKDEETLTVSITLNRVVAGILAYFKNIPYYVGGEADANIVKHLYVKVFAEGKAATLADRKAAGEAGAGYTLLDIDLTSELKDGDNNWYKNTNTTFNDNGTDVEIVANSFITGGYALPVLNSGSTPTIKVVLTGDGGATLKEMDVKVESTDGATDITTGTKIFPLVANYYYSLGKKLKNNTDGGGGGETPDEPIDLTNDQDLVITVSAEWAHKIGLDIEM